MKRAMTVVMAVFLAGLSAETVHSAVPPAKAAECDTATAADCLKAAPGEIPTMAPKATAVIRRTTDTLGRYAASDVSGTFKAGADVSIFTPGGDFVGRGRVLSVFGEELYVDVPDGGSSPIGTGSVVFMNYTPAEALAYVRSHRETVTSIAGSARREAARLQQEVSADERKEEADRRNWQEEMTRLKMQYSYKYGDYYLAPYPYGYYW